MNQQPSPAIVSQEAVRRLPRWGLVLFCLVYALAGNVGREPWRGDDIASFGYMLELAQGRADWMAPGLLGEPANFKALLPYWLGAWAIQLTSGWLTAVQAVQVVYTGLLLLSLAATWYAIYYLARSRQAQPVSFAFGGEAKPADYACAVADGGLLALLSCLGLAESAHLMTPPLVQLCCMALLFFGLAALPYRAPQAAAAAVAGMTGLVLSGAPTVAVMVGAMGVLVLSASPQADWLRSGNDYELSRQELARLQHRRWISVAGIALLVLACAGLASALGMWRWRVQPLPTRWIHWRDLMKLQLWFFWPTWLFALWTLWRWRRQWRGILPSRHIALPLGLVLLGSMGSLLTGKDQAMLLLALPASAALAAFALPTLKRSMGAFIDWFTLLLFSLAGAYVWFLWFAALTGIPSQPAARITRMLNGFTPAMQWEWFLPGVAATVGWVALVRWRTQRLRPAIWKSMILPAAGVCMCWILLTTLWLPALNHIRSYRLVAQQVAQAIGQPATPAGCVQQYGLEDGHLTALMYYGQLAMTRERASACPWLVVRHNRMAIAEHAIDMTTWQQVAVASRTQGNDDDTLVVFKRRQPY